MDREGRTGAGAHCPRTRHDGRGLPRLETWQVSVTHDHRVAISFVVQAAGDHAQRSEFVCSADDAIGVACALAHGAAFADDEVAEG